MTAGASRPRWRRRLAIAVSAPFAVLVALLALWRFAPPVSTLMLYHWARGEPANRRFTPLDQIAPSLARSVIASEDARFCRHWGVDWGELRDVMEDEDGPDRGASTISMQTAKNLFLWHGRSYVRKAIEIPLALALDLAWPKRRTLEVYLNIAEWGPGVFGAEAAAQRYFGRSAAQLTPGQSALLAAALPNPALRNPARPSPRHARVAAIIAARARDGVGLDDCL